MPIVGLSAILSVKVRAEGQTSPNCDFFFIFYISKAKISKLHRYIALSTKIDNSWSILSSRSKVKVKWSLNIKHSTSRNFLDIWQRNFKDSSKCPSWLEEHFVYWQLFSIFNRYGDISKRRPPPLTLIKSRLQLNRKYLVSSVWIFSQFVDILQPEVRAEILTRDTS